MAIRARLARIDRTLGSATSRFEDLQDKISGQLEEIQSEIQKVQSDVQTNIGDITDWKPTGFALDTDAILEAAGLDLTPEDRRAIAVLAGRIFIDER